MAVQESVLGARDLVDDAGPRDPETARPIMVRKQLLVVRKRRESVSLCIDQALSPVLTVRPGIPA